MAVMSIRVSDGLMAEVEAVRGDAKLSEVVREALGMWLEVMKKGEVVIQGSKDVTQPVIQPVIQPKAVKRGTDLVNEPIPENAVCGHQTRQGICGARATFARGQRYFCPEH